MALFVYVTDQCRNDANVHSIKAEIQLFKERVERTQRTSLFDPVGLEFRIRSLNRGLGHHCVAPEF